MPHNFLPIILLNYYIYCIRTCNCNVMIVFILITIEVNQYFHDMYFNDDQAKVKLMRFFIFCIFTLDYLNLCHFFHTLLLNYLIFFSI